MPLTEAQARALTSIEATGGPTGPHWFRIFMPYCLQKLSVEGHVWLPLNRNYKPVGYAGNEHLNYEDYLASAMVFTRDPHTFKDVWKRDQPTDKLWLYTDGTNSRLDYFERFERLMAKQIRLPK